MRFRLPHLMSKKSAVAIGFATTCLLTLQTAAQSPAQSESVRKLGAVKDVSSEAQLRQRIEDAAQAKAQKGPLGKPVEPSQSTGGASLYARSLLLQDSGHYTLIPQGAILHLPASQRTKLIGQPSGTFLTWTKFLKQNGSWLATREVSMPIATGESPKSLAKIIAELSTETHAVVAVCKDSPISIMEDVSAPQDNASVSPGRGGGSNPSPVAK
jgi:hypothetical protein